MKRILLILSLFLYGMIISGTSFKERQDLKQVSKFSVSTSTLNKNSVSDLITGVVPAMNAVNVNRASVINILFSQDMNASTINTDNIKVYGRSSGYMDRSVIYDQQNHKAVIDPVNDFMTGEQINVILKSGIQTLTGDSLEQFSYSFNVEATHGDGNFLQSLSVSDTLLKITNGDIDNDGDIDILALGIGYNIVINGNRGYHYKVFKNNGSGGFAISSDFFIGYGYAFDFPMFIKLADFDGDGDLDLLSQTVGILASLYITLNNGDGTFQNSPVYSHLVSPGSDAVVYDIDNDGDNDIIVHLESGALSCFINSGSAGFSISQGIIPGYDYSFSSAEIGDFDNDGDGDIFFKNRIFFNNNDGTFSDTAGIIAQDNFMNTVFYDFDNDGDLDIAGSLVHNYVTRYTEIFLNNGNGSFNLSQSIINSTLLAGGDFDADRDIDLILKSNDEKLYVNDGNGIFTEHSSLDNTYPLTNTNTSDFNNDGSMDLMALGEHIQTSNVNGYLNAYSYLNDMCDNPRYSVSGSTVIEIGSENNIYISSADSGYWNISNFDSTQASIPPDSEGDTVLVSAGDRLGHFVLYYTAHRDCGGDTLLSYHVYVDYPSPVELAAFTSLVFGRDVTLSWSTSNELNNSGFEIERAVDNGQLITDSWNIVGYVDGNGTIDEPKYYSFIDKNLQTGNYKYRLKQVDFNGNYEYYDLFESVNIGIPDKFSLSQNYPNPFNPVTNLEFGISELGLVKLKIYDVTGREVASLVNEIKEPGYYTIKFNASNLSSGVYFYRMTAGDFSAVKKFVVLK